MSATRALPAVTAGSVAVGVLAGLLVFAPSSQAASQPIVVWADQIRADVLNAQFPQGFRDVKLKIVVKESLTTIKQNQEFIRFYGDFLKK